MANKYVLGSLTLVILLTSIYIMLPGEVKISVGDSSTIFYVWESSQSYPNGHWVISGKEYSKLYNGSKRITANARSVTQENDGAHMTITRTAKMGAATVIDTYIFDGTITDKELFPIAHTIQVINGAGLRYQYEAQKLVYDGGARDAASPEKFGRNMKIEWDGAPYYAKLTKLLTGGKLTLKWRVTSNDETYNVRLFDPEEVAVAPAAPMMQVTMSAPKYSAVEIQTEAPYQISIDTDSINEWTVDNGDNTTSYYMSYKGTFQQQGTDKNGTKYLGFSFDKPIKAESYIKYRDATDNKSLWTEVASKDLTVKDAYVIKNVTKTDTTYKIDKDTNESVIDKVTRYQEVEKYDAAYSLSFSKLDKGTYKDFEVYVKMDAEPSKFIMYFGTGSTIIQLTKNGNLNVVVGENQTYGYVSNLRTADCTITTQNDTDTSLVGYWSFDDGTGYSIAHDGSRYENHGTLTNMNTVGNATSGWNTSGNISGALQFDGVDDHVERSLTPSLNISNYTTISGWFKINGFDVNQNQYGGVVTFGWENGCRLTSTLGQFSCHYRYNDGTWAGPSVSSFYTIGQWVFFAQVINYTHSTIYKNGVAVSTTALNLSKGGMSLPVAPLRFSTNFQSNNRTNGTIDEVKIYNRALNASEILNQFNNGKYRLNTITNLSSSACTFDIWSNTNRSLIYDIPELNKTISLTPTYVYNGTNVIFNTTNSDYVSNITCVATNNYLGNGNLTLLNCTSAKSMSVMDTPLINLTALGYSTNNNFNWVAYRRIDSQNRAWKQDNAIGYTDTCTTGVISNMVLCMPFEEGYSNNATPVTNDRSGFNNDGILTNMNLGIDNGSSGWTTSGKFGNGLQFDGTNDYVLTDLDTLGFNGITITAWIKRGAGFLTSSEGAVVTSLMTNYGVELEIENNDDIFIKGGIIANYTANIPANTWSMVGLTLNSTNATIIYNGVMYLVPITSGTISNFVNESVIKIGNRVGGSNVPFNGTIDEVRIYNRSLSASEITSEYNRGKDRLLLTRNEEGAYSANSDWLILLVNGTVQGNVNCTLGTGISIANYAPKFDMRNPPTNTSWLWVNATGQYPTVPLYNCTNVGSGSGQVQIKINGTLGNRTDTCSNSSSYSLAINLTNIYAGLGNLLSQNTATSLWCRRGYNATATGAQIALYNFTILHQPDAYA